MKELLIVDGYNIINSWRDVFDLEKYTMAEARVRLLDILSDYQGYSGHRLVVVFDAHMVREGLGSLDIHDNIKVVFTRENQTADNFIERFVKNYGAGKTIRVATGDYMEQKTVLTKGGLRMTPNELKSEIFTQIKEHKRHASGKADRDFLESRLTGEQKSIFESIRRNRTGY
ncbi:MAG: NYN domain-containing protein [Clostridia bacterium]|nr:NYN domain-containing protein [Clostridia bacterium]